MKASVKMSAMPTSPTANQDFTTGSFSSDVKAGIAFASRGKVSETIIETGMMSFGVIDDGATQATMSINMADNTGGTQDTRQQISTTELMNFADATANGSLAEGVGSILSTGVRIGWTDWNSNELIGMLMLGGSDVEASVCTGTFSGTTPVSVAHGLSGGAPHVIIGFCTGANSSSNGSIMAGIGFYDVGADTYRCITQRTNTGVTTTSIVQCWHTTGIYANTSATATDFYVPITNVGATTFDIATSATATSATIMFLCLRVTGADFQVGDFLTKDSVGTQADITGMSLAPKAVLYAGLRFDSSVAAGSPENVGSCECMTFGAAANNEGSTEVASIATFISDGVDLSVGVSDTKSASSSSSVFLFNNTGGDDSIFTVQSWDSGGVTHNYTASGGTPRRFMYLAIGPAAAGGGGAAKQSRFQAMLRNA